MADRQIQVVIGELYGLTERVIKKITLDVTANLLMTGTPTGTPVDTGWARANWVPSIGQPLFLDPGTQGREDQVARTPGRAGEQQGGLATVAATYKLNQGSVFISNNVPYIVRLNQGSSRQAPAGFVQGAIEKAVRVDLQSIR